MIFYVNVVGISRDEFSHIYITEYKNIKLKYKSNFKYKILFK